MDLSFYDSITGFSVPAGPRTVMVNRVSGDRTYMDYIVPLCYFLAILAVAYFALEFALTGLKARLYGAIGSRIRR